MDNENDLESIKAKLSLFRTVAEIPVIQDSIFTGVIKTRSHSISLDEKKQARYDLYCARYETKWKQDFLQKNISKILYNIKGKVIIYDSMKENNLSWSEQDWSEYKKRKSRFRLLYDFCKMSAEQQKNFWQELYHEHITQQFQNDFRTIRASIKDGIFRIADLQSDFFNIVDGHRINSIFPLRSNRKIFMVGPCFVFGAYVDDKHTIEHYLQCQLVNNNLAEYGVINCGTFEGQDYLAQMLATESCEEDIFCYFAENDELKIWEMVADNLDNATNIHWGSELTQVYNNIEKPTNNLFNDLRHCNHIINERLSNVIYNDIRKLVCSYNSNSAPCTTRTCVQNYFIPQEVVLYYKNKFLSLKLNMIDKAEQKGAIVMNCNPFTLGHRYLIEEACRYVDTLYILLVEEDKSYFTCQDRLQMVIKGTQDMPKVKVFPSGKYCISKETFAQYFEKDQVSEVEDMSYDLLIFGEVIARELDITWRFVGEELSDKVTLRYNELMKKILPRFGVSVLEIRRSRTRDDEIISASTVRKLIKCRDFDNLRSYVPETTLEYIRLLDSQGYSLQRGIE